MKRLILLLLIIILVKSALCEELSIEPQIENCIRKIVKNKEFQKRNIKNIWIGDFLESNTKQKRLISNLLKNVFSESFTSMTSMNVIEKVKNADAIIEGEFEIKGVWLVVTVRINVNQTIISSEDININIDKRKSLRDLCTQKISKEGPTGFISIETNKDPATVFIDYGEWKASSGQGMRLAVPAGKHDISVFKEGYKSKTFSVKINEGQIWSKYVKLEIGTGGIKISSTPSNADIYFDGHSTGKKTPFTIKNLKVGTYVIKVNHPDYKSAMTEITIEEEGEIKPVNFHLQGLPSNLTIRLTNVDGAEIYLDGKYKGKTKNKLIEIPEISCGKHLIKVSKSGYSTYKRKFRMRANEPKIIKVSLSDNPKIECPKGKLKDIPSDNTISLLSIPCNKFKIKNGFAKHPLGNYVTSGDINNWRNYNLSSIIIVPTKHLTISPLERIKAFISSAIIPYSGEGFIMKDIRNTNWLSYTAITFLPFVGAYSCDKTEEHFYNNYVNATNSEKKDLYLNASQRNQKHKKYFIGLGAGLWGYSILQTLFRKDRIIPSSPDINIGGLEGNLKIIGLTGLITSYLFEAYHIYNDFIFVEIDTISGEVIGYGDKSWGEAMYSLIPFYHEYALIKELSGEPHIVFNHHCLIDGNSKIKAGVLLGLETLGLLTGSLNFLGMGSNHNVSLNYNPDYDNMEIKYVLRF